MSALQIVALVVCLAVTAVAVALFAKVVGHFLVGLPARPARPDPHRRQGRRAPGRCCASSSATPGCRGCRSWRWRTGSRWSRFGVLFFTLLNAFGQLFDPDFALPLIGHFVALRVGHRASSPSAGFVGILVLMAIRQQNHPRRPPARTAGSPLLRVDVLAGLLRRADHPRRHPLHPDCCAALEYALGQASRRRGQRHARCTSRSPAGSAASFTGLSVGAARERRSSSSPRSRSSSRSRG